MKIDLTCPVELWQSAMPAEDVSECTFVLNNLSHKVVVSLLLTLSCYDQDNRLLFRQSERMQGLKVVPGERFSVMMVPNEWKNVKEAEVTLKPAQILVVDFNPDKGGLFFQSADKK